MESLVLNGVLLPRKHENGSRSSEASQSPTVHEQIVQNPWEVCGRSQDQHLIIESAMNPISVSRALVATTTATATTTTGPEPEMNIGVPSNITLPGTQAPIQPDQSFQESPPTSIVPPANEHRAASRAATLANSFKHRLAFGAHSARKRQKTGNEDVPTLCSDTTGHSETPCDGNVGPDSRVRHSGGVPNHQAVTACSNDAIVASQSLQLSRRTSNHNSHASSSRWGIGQAVTSQSQNCDEEQEGKSLKNVFLPC
jgi:hypothetical protein